MEKKTNTIMIVVVLALAVVAIGWYGVTGGAISSAVMTCNVCNDQFDGGAAKDHAGITTCDNRYKADYCSGTKIYEYYCIGNNLRVKTMQCSQGCTTQTIDSDRFGEVTAQECRIR